MSSNAAAVRVHGVREPALLADLLEQPRRHAAAERLVHDGERVAVGIEASRTARNPSTRCACSVGRVDHGDRARAARARRARATGRAGIAAGLRASIIADDVFVR